MKFLADENFPRPALVRCERRVGMYSRSPRTVHAFQVIALSADQERVLFTFDKDFGELVFRHGPSAAGGVVLFRITPESPDDAAGLALALVDSQPDLAGTFCVVTHDRIRVRQIGLPQVPGDQGTSAI
jgi:predicted nuclease of predicted toxin-antitoxin system